MRSGKVSPRGGAHALGGEVDLEVERPRLRAERDAGLLERDALEAVARRGRALRGRRGRRLRAVALGIRLRCGRRRCRLRRGGAPAGGAPSTKLRSTARRGPRKLTPPSVSAPSAPNATCSRPSSSSANEAAGAPPRAASASSKSRPVSRRTSSATGQPSAALGGRRLRLRGGGGSGVSRRPSARRVSRTTGAVDRELAQPHVAAQEREPREVRRDAAHLEPRRLDRRRLAGAAGADPVDGDRAGEDAEVDAGDLDGEPGGVRAGALDPPRDRVGKGDAQAHRERDERREDRPEPPRTSRSGGGIGFQLASFLPAWPRFAALPHRRDWERFFPRRRTRFPRVFAQDPQTAWTVAVIPNT